MENHDAQEIITHLANGLHPHTHTPLPTDSIYNDPEIIRALFTALGRFPKRKRAIAERQKENVERGMPKNSGLPWTDVAREAVAKEFANGCNIEKLAKTQERSPTAIAAELHRQGLLSDTQAQELGYTFRTA